MHHGHCAGEDHAAIVSPHPSGRESRAALRDAVCNRLASAAVTYPVPAPVLPEPVLAELRPNRRSYGRAVLPVAPLAALYLVFRLVRSGASLGVALAVAVVVAGAIVGIALLYLSTTTLVLTPSALVRRGLLGRTRVVEPGRVAGAVLAWRYRPLNGVESPLFALLDHSGRALLRVQGPQWDTAEVAAFARATGVPLTEVPQPVSRRDLRPWCPGALVVSERRPVAFFLGVLGATMAAIALVAVVVVALGG